tara:strand:+ start:3078 stop:3185 length:108 start_codon:yes stop_codon:yes gene_type:complete
VAKSVGCASTKTASAVIEAVKAISEQIADERLAMP